MERKILVALDGSIQDSHTIHYINTVFKNQPEIVFTFATVLPSPNLSESRQLLDSAELEHPSDSRSLARKIKHQRHHDAVTQKLVQQGFSADQFETVIVFSPTAPALKLYTIGQKNLYDALLLARRGLDMLTTMITGSTSKTILNKSHTMPIWVLNGEPNNAHFMIPVDCSPHCMAGIDHLAFILHDNPNATITLFHSTSFMQREPDAEADHCYLKWGKEWQEQMKCTDTSCHYHFFAAQMILREAGFPTTRTNTATPIMDIEPARAIIRYSEKSHFDTIVLGRRPDSDKGFFKGVSDRVLANAKNCAIWIVG